MIPSFNLTRNRLNSIIVRSPIWPLLLAFFAGGAAPRLDAAPHRYDHIVIVVEENRRPGQIIGDIANAPYITSLANAGVKIGSIYALQHPSQPNYLHMFSGDTQGVINDSLPPNFSTTPTSTYPFRTPNLGAELIAAGLTFAGYSEQLEAAGASNWADYDPHSATDPNVKYRRKHNPWANWVAKVNPILANQLPSTVNLSFTNFPSDFNTLPTVSFVIPNQDNDMHDGSRKAGDDWLRANLNVYAVWAATNNSLLIVTWDEDDYNSVNQIPTLFSGAALRNGTTTAGTWTLHNLLRTIEDMYGAGHAGSAARVRPIIGAFTNDPIVGVRAFRQGLAGYAGAQDTQLWEENPDVNYATLQNLTADLDTATTAGNQVAQVLVRFNSIFGTNTDQVPTNATIHSAKLILFTPLSPSGLGYESNDRFGAHRMLVDWSDAATWNSLNAGVSIDDIEAATTDTFSLVPKVDGAPAIFDVTSDIELFLAGTPNYGWVFRALPTATGDGWTLRASESTDATNRPTLEIVYSVPFTPYGEWAANNGVAGFRTAPGEDFDRDGALNLAEFAYNMNPRVRDARSLPPGGTSGLPAPYYLSESGGILEVEFIRRIGPTAAGLTYNVSFSDNLVDFPTIGSEVVTPIDSTWERVRVRDAVFGANSQRFAKVMLTLQQ